MKFCSQEVALYHIVPEYINEAYVYVDNVRVFELYVIVIEPVPVFTIFKILPEL
jgi:hypothetical protein